MSVQELARKVNNDIHNRMFQTNHFNASFGDYEKCFTSLDLIEDCQDAIDEFISIPEDTLPNRSVLNIYGVLQATFCQQDGLYGLYQNISREKINNIGDFFSTFNFDKQNREIRNDIVGHPTTRKNNTEFYFIDKGLNSKYNFSYGGYSPRFTEVNVDLKKILQEQKLLAINVLNNILEMIKNKIEDHKESHKDDDLCRIVSNLEYSIQLIRRGYSDEIRAFQAGSAIKVVKLKIKEVEDKLINRYNSNIPDSIEYTLKTICYILDKIEKWFNDNDLLHNKDAKIFMIAFDKEFESLRKMLKEVDEEYKK